MGTVNDKEIINMMRQAAEKLCDESMDRWWNYKYTNNQEEINININLWKDKKRRVAELCEILQNINDLILACYRSVVLNQKNGLQIFTLVKDRC